MNGQTAPGSVFVVLNGKSAADAAVREALLALREAGREVAVRVTWEAGDAARQVAEALTLGVASVVAAGGDGTLNEVAGALADTGLDAGALPALAVLPLGTANDFARSAGIPDTAAEALRLLETPPQAMDMLRVGLADGSTQWCANLATGGFGTRITAETDPELKRRLGGLAYVITGLGRMGEVEAMQVRVRGEAVDAVHPFIALGIGNGRQAGGGQVLCPHGRVNDGLMDLTLIPPPGDAADFWQALRVAFSEGKAAALEQMGLCLRGTWFELSHDEPFHLNLDGEPALSTRFRIDCIPHCLRVHLPPASPLLSEAA